MNEKIQKLIDEICKLTVLEVGELTSGLKEKLGISFDAPVNAVAIPQQEEQPKEKTEFNVVLKEAGLQKISVIKLVREITDKQLMECKVFVESCPKVIGSGLTKEEANEMKSKFEELGAIVDIV